MTLVTLLNKSAVFYIDDIFVTIFEQPNYKI